MLVEGRTAGLTGEVVEEVEDPEPDAAKAAALCARIIVIMQDLLVLDEEVTQESE